MKDESSTGQKPVQRECIKGFLVSRHIDVMLVKKY